MSEWIIRDSRPLERVQHPSTEAALLAMRGLAERLPAPPAEVLDVGCGSGLLTLAAGTLWPEARLYACDISPQAVADCQANMEVQGIANRIMVRRSDALSHPDIQAARPYGLLAANLLAEILVAHARALVEAVRPGGHAILSGILAWRLEQVLAAWQALPVDMEEEIAINQWRALVVRRRPLS